MPTSRLSALRIVSVFLLLAALCLLPALVGRAAAQLAPVLTLPAPTATFASPEFYVAHVLDERPTRTAVAWLLTPAPKPGPPAAQRPVDLQGGGLPAIRQFISRSLPQAPNRRPLTIRVLEFRAAETPVPGATGQVEGRVTLKMALEWQQEGRTIALTQYQGGARYGRPLTQSTVVGPVLAQSLTEGLRYLSTWVNSQARTNVQLATGLRLRFTDFKDQTEPDTLFYDPTRPLAWTDFTAPPRTGPFAAAVFPSFAYAGQPRLVNGVLELNLRMKVFVVRSSSWVSAAARADYDLNHEQRHFDLVKLVTERFKRRLTPERLNLKDYNSIVQYEYLMAFQEMNRLQEQYDNETHHGTNQAVQETWNQRIDQELQQYGLARRPKTASLPAAGY